MADDGDHPAPPLRLMTFVSQDELEHAKKTRGERADDGTAQRDKPLFEILQENKDRKDAEFNERFKHRPPKALDEDESEFLDNLEMKAVAAQSSIVRELKETPTLPKPEEIKPVVKKTPHARPLGGLIISVKPQAKKAKTERTPNGSSDMVGASNGDVDEKPLDVAKGPLGGLVSYSDESEEDD